MPDDNWVVLDTVYGSAMAGMLRGLLEANGITVILSQEGVGDSVYPVSVGPLSAIEFLVPVNQLPQAQQVLADYQSGKFENLYTSEDSLSEPPAEEAE